MDDDTNQQEEARPPQNRHGQRLKGMGVSVYFVLAKQDLKVAGHMYEYKPNQYNAGKGHEVFFS
jgi:hypothetical protein